MIFDAFDDMQDDNLQNDTEYVAHNMSYDSVSGENVSFTGHIDDIYDPEINRAYDDLNNHTEEFLHSRTDEESQSSLDHIMEDRRSIDYWEDCKHNAMIESKKNNIFLDGINAQLKIIEKYRK